jgi:hypothetical protein
MAKQDSFTPEEWSQLRIAGTLVAGGTSASDPSGFFSQIREAAAGAGAMLEAFKANPDLELLSALAADRSMPTMAEAKAMLGEGSREQQISNLKAAVLVRVKEAAELVARKASPAEADAYRKMLVDVAQKAADASTEGGFLGFGGVRVSDKEQSFIEEVKKAAGIA